MTNNQNIKILLADDSAFMRQYLIGFLHEAGFTKIFEAGNGKLAVEIFKIEAPDVVLLDLIMPVKTGVEALKELVELNARVIVVSAVGQKSIIDQALKDGARGYFVKPFFDSREIAAKIEEALS